MFTCIHLHNNTIKKSLQSNVISCKILYILIFHRPMVREYDCIFWQMSVRLKYLFRLNHVFLFNTWQFN